MRAPLAGSRRMAGLPRVTEGVIAFDIRSQFMGRVNPVAPVLPSLCDRLLYIFHRAAWCALGEGFLYGLTGHGTRH